MTELTYLQIQEGSSAIWAFIGAVVLVFLVLASQYESYTMPLAVILVVPMCLLAALLGLAMARMDINIFVQVGFVVLVGLASKNAILIVEFARAKEGRDVPNRGHAGGLRAKASAHYHDLLCLYSGVVPWWSPPGPERKCGVPWARRFSAACWE